MQAVCPVWTGLSHFAVQQNPALLEAFCAKFDSVLRLDFQLRQRKLKVKHRKPLSLPVSTFDSPGYSLKDVYVWPALMHADYKIGKSIVIDIVNECHRDPAKKSALVERILKLAGLTSWMTHAKVDHVNRAFRDPSAFEDAPVEVQCICAMMSYIINVLWYARPHIITEYDRFAYLVCVCFLRHV